MRVSKCKTSQQTSKSFAEMFPSSLDIGVHLTNLVPNRVTHFCTTKNATYCDVKLLPYLANLSKGRLILWCYFIWYLVVLVRYFDPSPRLWLTSVGLSLIIGFALYVSTTAAGEKKLKLERWQVIRLFMMPFCVSSFSALVKGRGFILIFSPRPKETLFALLLCAAFCGLV